MVTRSRVLTAAFSLVVASATGVAIGCGALIGIEDGVPDPGTDATTTTDATIDATDGGEKDASIADTSTAPDVTVPPGPIGKPGGSTTSLPCGNATCAIPTETCCAYRTTQTTMYTGVCEAQCAPPGPGTDVVAVLKCSDSSNCPANAPRCCLPVSGSPAVTTCRTGCNSQSEVQLCDPGSSNQCGGRPCTNFTGRSMPTKWGYCN